MRVQCPGCDTQLRIPAADEGRKVECPDCGEVFRARADDEPEDAAPRKRGKGKPAPGTSNAQTFQIAGGVAAAVLAVGAVVWVVASRPKADPPKAEPAAPVLAAAPDRGKATFPPNANPNPVAGMIGPGVVAPGGALVPPPVATTRPAPRPPAAEADEFGDLFRRPVAALPPKVRLANLEHGMNEVPLDVPSFHSLRLARQAAPKAVRKADKLTLDEVKRATAYVKVKAGDLSGTGSGFLIGSIGKSGLVATNHHVIEAAMVRPAPGAPRPEITVVFNSGRSDEVTYPAKVTAIDPVADLAVLVIPGGKLPKPIDPTLTPPLTETMEVRISGFPLGEMLATAGENPNISVSNGSVSSLRYDKGGRLDKVQITGPIIPGNSGGPIVDKDGRLVGITVSQLTGRAAGIGFAVPVNELISLMEGKLMVTAFLPTGLDGGAAKFRVVVPVMDPFGNVKTVYLRYWTGEGARPKAVKDKGIGYKPIERAEQLNLPVVEGPTSLSVATAELTLPADLPEVVLQVASEVETWDGLRMTAASPPVGFTLAVADQPSGYDAKPFAELTRNPAARPGEVVVVRGKILGPPASRAPVQELAVAGLDGKRPPGLRFVTSRELAAQFDEVESDHQPLDARLACVIGTRGADGVVPVRVARVDFLEEGDRVVRSIPAADPGDPLAALNRDPARFAGQSLELKVEAAPAARRPANPDEFVVVFPNLHRPRNLLFVTTPGLTQRLADEKLKATGLYKVRLSVTVAPPAAGDRPDAPTKVTVRKIDILDPKDDSVVLKTVE